jgi:hypothetical protein
MAHTMKETIEARIDRLGAGTPFTAKDFLDIASRGSIDMALTGLAKEGKVRRIRRGLYDVPKISAALGGELSPDIDETARAIARRFRWKIVPDGAWAANLLGLSTQVPAKTVYLSDGPSKTVPIGRRIIQFKHARPQAIADAEGKSALVIQALRYLGMDNIDEKARLRLRHALSDAERRQLLKATRHGVDWIYAVAKEIAQESP